MHLGNARMRGELDIPHYRNTAWEMEADVEIDFGGLDTATRSKQKIPFSLVNGPRKMRELALIPDYLPTARSVIA